MHQIFQEISIEIQLCIINNLLIKIPKLITINIIFTLYY